MCARWTLGQKIDWEWAACRTTDHLLKTKFEERFETRLYGLIPEEQADKAAKWWADHIRGRVPHGTGRQPNPLQLEIAFQGLLTALQDNLIEQPDTESRADIFEEILSKKLQAKIAYPRGVSLTTDYNPCRVLAECWKLSNPEDKSDSFGRFPLKTRMKVYKDKVTLGWTTHPEENDKVI